MYVRKEEDRALKKEAEDSRKGYGRGARSKTRTPIPIKKEASRKREGCSG